MKRVGLTLLVVAITTATAYYVATHPSWRQAERLEEEVDQLRDKNERLAEQNDKLERAVEALDDEGRLAERRARETSGLVRSDEVIFEFDEEDDDGESTEVKLSVEPDSARLAGRRVEVERLQEVIDELDKSLDGARLTVVFSEETDELRRQRIREVVADSAMSDAEFVSSHDDE